MNQDYEWTARNMDRITALREQCFVCAFTPKLDLSACMVCSHMKQMIENELGAKKDD